jgi:hypothetical protein
MMGRRKDCRLVKGQQCLAEDVNIAPLERKAMLRWIGCLGGLAASLALACGRPAPPTPPAPPPAPDPSLYSGERAWEHLERLVEIGPRVTGTPAAEEARSYIRAQLEALGLEPSSVSFGMSVGLPDGKIEEVILESLVAEMPGESEDLVILAAPFDSRRFESFTHLGANNGASGAALLLEMARVLSLDPLPYTVWLAFLDGEAPYVEGSRAEQGFVGSQALVAELHETDALPRVRLVVYFNQVADRDLVIAKDLNSDRVVRQRFEHAAKELGHESVFPQDQPFSRPPGGHLVFLSVGIRRVMAIIDDRFGGDEAPGIYRETEEDTLERCDPESLAIVGTVGKAGLEEVVALLQKVDRFSRRPVPVPPPEPVEAPEPPGVSPGPVNPSP